MVGHPKPWVPADQPAEYPGSPTESPTTQTVTKSLSTASLRWNMGAKYASLI